MKIVCTLILYVAITLIVLSAGIDITKWQYWAIMICVLAVDAVAFMRGMER